MSTYLFIIVCICFFLLGFLFCLSYLSWVKEHKAKKYAAIERRLAREKRKRERQYYHGGDADEPTNV